MNFTCWCKRNTKQNLSANRISGIIDSYHDFPINARNPEIIRKFIEKRHGDQTLLAFDLAWSQFSRCGYSTITIKTNQGRRKKIA